MKVTRSSANRIPSKNVEVPLSPTSKKTKWQLVEQVKDRAMSDLFKMQALNGGMLKYGDLARVVNRYQAMNFPFITRSVLRKRLGKLLANGATTITVVDVVTTEAVVDSVTTDIVGADLEEAGPVAEAVVELEDIPNVETTTTTAKKGRPTNKSIKEYKNKVAFLTTLAATKFHEARVKAESDGKLSVPNGTLAKIIAQLEEEHGLEKKIIKPNSIISRLRRGNFHGIAPQKVSPLAEIEPLLVTYCRRLAKMGMPRSRDQVCSLMQSLISGTAAEARYIQFLKDRGFEVVKVPNHKNEPVVQLGKSWYNGFVKRHSDLIKSGKSKVKDSKRQTWCTIEHFTEMYACAYGAMAEAGVAEILAEEAFFDSEGNETTKENAVGLPTKFKLTHPEWVLFVDEVGSNTNQKEDGYVGGEKLILLQEQAHR